MSEVNLCIIAFTNIGDSFAINNLSLDTLTLRYDGSYDYIVPTTLTDVIAYVILAQSPGGGSIIETGFTSNAIIISKDNGLTKTI
jgi:hypothetical protein